MLDNKKIAFIICTNNELYFSEAKYYISRLDVPSGYDVELIAVNDASSMSSGYNEAMKSSDAKYKIYLHQDVFIINTKFLITLLNIFNDSKIGLVGVVGGSKAPINAFFASTWNTKYTYHCDSRNTKLLEEGFDNNYIEVNAIDGMLMATQYDIEWDEDFDAWDFYDASQSIRFQEAGYQLVLARDNDMPWTLHDEGYCVPRHYDKYRKLFCNKYSDFGFKFDYDLEHRQRIIEEFDAIKFPMLKKIEQGNLYGSDIQNDIKHLNEMGVEDTDLSILIQLLEANQRGEKVLWPLNNLLDSIQIYHKIKFAIWKMELNCPKEDYAYLILWIKEHLVSLQTVIVIANNTAFNPQKALERLRDAIQ